MAKQATKTSLQCYHCAEDCSKDAIHAHNKDFCCNGCKMVYEILNKNGLCNYYNISNHPGVKQRHVRDDKFAFLDDEKIQVSLVSFKDDTQTHVRFYLPQVHCSSCLWLLENLHRLNENIIGSKVDFERKEATIIFNHKQISLREVAETLTAIGYEPYISLNNLNKKTAPVNRAKIYKLGIAGFCFANSMLLSFPEYLGINAGEAYLIQLFRYINVGLSLPVFFYALSEFYNSAWKSLKHGFLNIDAPVVLAVTITFIRSLYEVFTATGGGYFDSMSGIVFFMLAGRVLQDKTYNALSFERDYTSYFPIAVTKVTTTGNQAVTLPNIQLDDTLLIHHEELIPADGILTRGRAIIDYSFVTGESIPIVKEMGEIVYAGGKQTGSNIEILVIKKVAQSYLTSLWNRDELQTKKQGLPSSFVHLLSRHFTWAVMAVAFITAIYWWQQDVSKIWASATAVLIVACPCALLLSNTFTNGNILRRLGRNHFYLRNAQTIEAIASTEYIVFDKTGTLTMGQHQHIIYEGKTLTKKLRTQIATLAAQSNHPMSKAIVAWLNEIQQSSILAFKEHAGKGIEGIVDDDLIALGSLNFITGQPLGGNESMVHVAIEGKPLGCFRFKNNYREGMPALMKQLKNKFELAVLSGDNAGEKNFLHQILGNNAVILFNQTPEDKMNMVQQLQQKGKKVMMIGDGLNDAGALKVADAGIAVAEDCNSFTPASDAILDAAQLPFLYRFILLCRINKKIVVTAFVVSIFYNVIGLYYAVQGTLAPVVAAILMPASSITIVLITFGISNVTARKLKLH